MLDFILDAILWMAGIVMACRVMIHWACRQPGKPPPPPKTAFQAGRDFARNCARAWAWLFG